MRTFIRRLSVEQGKTVFISSHQLHEVEQICDQVLILNKGCVITQGRVSDLLSQTHRIEIRIDHAAQAAKILGRLEWVKDIAMDADWLPATYFFMRCARQPPAWKACSLN